MLKPFCRATLAISGLFILAGCDSSTGPNHITPAQLARHIDSLSWATKYGDRYSVLYVAENGPADGVTPVSIVVTTGSGPQTWSGYIMRYVGSVSGADSNYDLVAYSDYSLTDVLWAETRYFPVQGPGAMNGTAIHLLLGDSLVRGGSGTATMAMQSAGGGCKLAPGLENYTYLPPGTCNLATFTGSLSASFPGASAEFQTISIAAKTFPGLSDQSNP